jgi:hypothetical protein
MAVNVIGHAPFRRFRTKDLQFFWSDLDQSAGDDFANAQPVRGFVPLPHLNHQPVEHGAGQGDSSLIGSGDERKRCMSGQVETVLRKMGQSLRPISEAPKDGRWILAKSALGLVVCHWVRDPAGLAGPTWLEANDASRGYLDDYFEGWIDPAELKLWDFATLADLLIAFVDEAHARGDERALRTLQSRARAE